MPGFYSPIEITRASKRLSGLFLNAAALNGIAKKMAAKKQSAEHYRHLADLNQQFADKICRNHGLRVHVNGKPLDDTAIYVANHLGYIDPILIVSQAPMLAVSKMEVAGWPVLGTAMASCGVLFVKRGDIFSGVRLLRKSMQLLGEGVSILNFPEGSTTCGDTMLPFHRGFFGLARRINIPVVPVCIEYMDPSLAWYGDMVFFPHYFKTSAKQTIDVQLTFGDPVQPHHFISPESFAAYCRAIIMQNKLSPPFSA